MSSNSITIKPNNHRVYQCPAKKKIELLNKIISENETADILVITSKEPQNIIELLDNKSIKVIEDRELIKLPDLKCEMLISYDLPIKAIVYMARVTKATSKAILILDESEQKELYHTEMLLGRAIKQETIEGFEYQAVDKKRESKNPVPKKMTKDQIKDVAKKRYSEKTQEPKEYKSKRDFKDRKKGDTSKSDSGKKWEKKRKEPNKFLGYDENGKAKFSGKTGDRNHRYDGTPRDKYDAPKKVGRKINIKARKPSEQE